MTRYNLLLGKVLPTLDPESQSYVGFKMLVCSGRKSLCDYFSLGGFSMSRNDLFYTEFLDSVDVGDGSGRARYT